MLDCKIMNAQVIDGSGKPAFRADVGLREGRIAALGDLRETRAGEVIDARGRCLTPGFLDIHRHADLALLGGGFGDGELRQGLTAIVPGNCGLSAAPLDGPFREEVRRYLAPITGDAGEQSFPCLGDYLRRCGERPLPLHAGELIGMGTLRAGVAGFRPGPLTAEEAAAIRASLERALSDGALGVSLGLGYAPESYESTEELIALLAPLRRSGVVISVHMRQEGDGVEAALSEMLTVARALETPVEISHLKAIGRRNWRRSVPRMLRSLADARAEGLDISCDVYPYAAGSTQLIHVLPPESHAGGLEALTARLRDEAQRAAIRKRMETGSDFENITLLVGFENVRPTGLRTPEYAPYEGVSLSEIAHDRRQDPFDALFDLLTAEDGTPGMIDTIASEDDIAEILKAPFSCVISDATYPGTGLLHPRVTGMTAQLLTHFVRERRDLTLEEAVNRLTLRPAERYGLAAKGRIALGADADLCLFDPERFHAAGSYAQPRRAAEGMDWVFVSGHAAIREGALTGEARGAVLRR